MSADYSHHRNHLTNLKVEMQNNTDTIINLSYDNYNGGVSNGRVQKITDAVDSNYTTTYEYDEYNRLNKACNSNYYREYTYDAWDNLTDHYATGQGESNTYSLSYSPIGGGNAAPATNRIANTGYSYDAAGHLTALGLDSYSYDAANRMITAPGSSFEYDGDGHRVKKAMSGDVYYLWSSVLNQPVVELTSSGSAAQIYQVRVYSASGQQVALLSQDGNFYWVHTDHLGSGRRLTTTSGAVAYRGEFDPHGQVVLETLTSPGQSYSNSKKFTGYERDWATNLDNANARMYHHNRNRFLQPDPAGLAAADSSNPQSLNLYSYVGNDPINNVDPSGLNAEAPTCYLLISGTHWDDGTTTISSVRLFCVGGGGSGGTGGSQQNDAGGGSGGGGQQSNSQQTKPCPPRTGLTASLEVNVSAFAGFGAGGAVTYSRGTFTDFSNRVHGIYTSAGAYFLNHSTPALPKEIDPMRPATGVGYTMGASMGLTGMVSISRNSSASSYDGVSRNTTITAFGLALSISQNQGSSIPTSIGVGGAFGPGIGVVSQPVRTLAKDNSKDCP